MEEERKEIIVSSLNKDFENIKKVDENSFNDAGYKGLYGMPLANVENKKGIKKGETSRQGRNNRVGREFIPHYTD